MSKIDAMPPRAEVAFTCHGTATGKMRNELAVAMTKPMHEEFTLASDEGPFHGGDASAPPPLALFIAGLTGCIMTQLRAFAKRMDVRVDRLEVHAEAVWDWAKAGRVYETGPKSFAIDIDLDSPDPREKVVALVEAAQKGCFLEQTLGQPNTITHRLRTAEGYVEV